MGEDGKHWAPEEKPTPLLGGEFILLGDLGILRGHSLGGGSAAEDWEKPLAGAELKLQLLSPFFGSLCKRLCPASHCIVMYQLRDGSTVEEGSGISAESALKQLCPFPGHSKYVHTTWTKREHCERAAHRKQIDSTQKHSEAFHIHSPVPTWGIRASFLQLS